MIFKRSNKKKSVLSIVHLLISSSWLPSEVELSSSPFYSWGSWVTERLSSLSNITQIIVAEPDFKPKKFSSRISAWNGILELFSIHFNEEAPIGSCWLLPVGLDSWVFYNSWECPPYNMVLQVTCPILSPPLTHKHIPNLKGSGL